MQQTSEIIPQKEAPRIEWIDIAKGGAILMVVFFHASIQIEESTSGLPGPIWQINNYLLPILMPLFFFVSGYLSRRAVERGWRALLLEKTILYFYLIVIWSCIIWAQSVLLASNSESLFEYLKSNLFPPQNRLWFIAALGLYFPLTKLVLPWHKAGFVLAAGSYLTVSLGNIEFDSYVYENLLSFYVFFLGGCIWGAIAVSKLKANLLHAGAAAAIYLSLMAASTKLSGALSTMATAALPLIGLILGCYAAIFIARVGGISRIGVYLGKTTLPIYLAHSIIISIAVHAVPWPDELGLLFSGGAVILLTGLGVIASLVLRNAAIRMRLDWLYSLPWAPTVTSSAARNALRAQEKY